MSNKLHSLEKQMNALYPSSHLENDFYKLFEKATVITLLLTATKDG